MTTNTQAYKPGGLQNWSIGPTFPWTVVGVVNEASRRRVAGMRPEIDPDTVQWQPWNTLTDERGPIFFSGYLADRWIERRIAAQQKKGV